MSNEAGGPGIVGQPPSDTPPPDSAPPDTPPPDPSPPDTPAPAYGQPTGYGPPPGYGLAYGPPPGYTPPPGYAPPGYPPPGYGGFGGYGGYAPQPFPPPALKPGVIPLRPLTLSDIFNGAVAYIRANPKATLGFTAIVVITTQVLALVLTVGPLAIAGELAPTFTGGEPSMGALLGSSLSSLAGGIASWLASTLLTGLLTVIVGRAVFGAGITIGEAWQRLKGRFLALVGYSLLEMVGAILLVAIVFGLIVWIAFAAGVIPTIVIGLPLAMATVAAFAYLWTKLSFAPALIVLERLPILASIERSFALVRKDFWRVFGIRLLAVIVIQMIAGAIAIPFSIGSQVIILTTPTAAMVLLSLGLLTIGGSIAQIITAPFDAGVVVLLYTDRRIRAEAFDLVLQTGAAYGSGSPADSTDHLWLTRQT